MASLREQQHDATIKAIKTIAHEQMVAEGTAAISLRGIARGLGITAPAIYRYFADRDALITSLLVDAFNGLADALEAAEAAEAHDDYFGRLMAFLTTYRRWAIENRTDYQLIYGNPIPGYVAPGEITIAVAQRPYDQVVRILGEALAAGVLKPQFSMDDVPAQVTAQLAAVGEYEGYGVPTIVLYIGLVGWTRIHGMITLELFEDTQALAGDSEALYRYEVTRFCSEMNLMPKP